MSNMSLPARTPTVCAIAHNDNSSTEHSLSNAYELTSTDLSQGAGSIYAPACTRRSGVLGGDTAVREFKSQRDAGMICLLHINHRRDRCCRITLLRAVGQIASRVVV